GPSHAARPPPHSGPSLPNRPPTGQFGGRPGGVERRERRAPAARGEIPRLAASRDTTARTGPGNRVARERSLVGGNSAAWHLVGQFPAGPPQIARHHSVRRRFRPIPARSLGTGPPRGDAGAGFPRDQAFPRPRPLPFPERLPLS